MKTERLHTWKSEVKKIRNPSSVTLLGNKNDKLIKFDKIRQFEILEMLFPIQIYNHC